MQCWCHEKAKQAPRGVVVRVHSSCLFGGREIPSWAYSTLRLLYSRAGRNNTPFQTAFWSTAPITRLYAILLRHKGLNISGVRICVERAALREGGASARGDSESKAPFSLAELCDFSRRFRDLAAGWHKITQIPPAMTGMCSRGCLVLKRFLFSPG